MKNRRRNISIFAMVFAITIPCIAEAQSVKVNQLVWSDFSASERVSILAKFSDIEVIPTDSVGTIQSVQVVNRSVAASNNGAALGSVLAQAAYIDHAAKGTSANYSAKTQVGAALLGAAAGATLDTPSHTRFLLNYGIKTADGQIHEVHIESDDELVKPSGQCVYLADLSSAPPVLCLAEKVPFLKHLSSLSDPAQADRITPRLQNNRPIACRVPNVGLMTLESTACNQLNGIIEK